MTDRDDKNPRRGQGERDDSLAGSQDVPRVDADEMERIRNLMSDYNTPPAVPRDEMWTRIERTRHGRPRFRLMTWTWPVAAAAALFVGIFLGRGFFPTNETPVPTPEVAEAEQMGSTIKTLAKSELWDEDATRATYRFVVGEYLSRAEAYLTQYRKDSRTGAPEAEARLVSSTDEGSKPWARTLLGEARMLLGSPIAEDPEIHDLFEDLELVLVQIVQVEDSSRPDASKMAARDRIDRSLNDQALLDRLRIHIPLGVGGLGG